MSRSQFAGRFSLLLGKSPMAFLAQIRLGRAAQELTRGASVTAVAEQSGYASEMAFSRAFRKWVGDSPGRYRRLSSERI